jgi:transcriptional regulator with XRE-family HTH domain
MDDQTWRIVGERIHIMRRRRGLTSLDLARLAGTGRTTISRLENNSKPSVSFAVLFRIAEALDVSLDYLTGRKERETIEVEAAAEALVPA